MDLICRKLGLAAGMRLDIGCGWGGFARHAAEHYGCTVVGITFPRQQAYAAGVCRGLPVEIRLQVIATWWNVRPRRERGNDEHVGCKNYRTYMEAAAGACGVRALPATPSRATSRG